MAPDPDNIAWLGLHRFGFGPKAGSPAYRSSDLRDALLAELDKPKAGLISGAELLSSGEAARRTNRDITERRTAQAMRIRMEREHAEEGSRKGAMQEPDMQAPEMAEPARRQSRRGPNQPQGPNMRVRLYHAEAEARTQAVLSAETGMVERLVWFWSNHFCIDARKPTVRPIAGAYEREAIRSHVLGRFSDMLLAMASHPAMLLSLDQARSMGPNSTRGRHRERGLNENFARELLELHTLGVRSVYTQEDVTELAKVLTGWTVVRPSDSNLVGGEFEFNPDHHEPGARTVIGRRYAATVLWVGLQP